MVMIGEPSGAADDLVGQRLSLHGSLGRIVAYFPKTQKHRVRYDDGDHHEKNVRLGEVDHQLLPTSSSHSNAVCEAAVGRRLEIFHAVRQKWYQATITRYVPDCQQHALQLEPQGKVHLVDLTQQHRHVWRYTDLLGGSMTKVHTLATSKYMGVERLGESAWKAYYDCQDKTEPIDIGCFGSEKDAALAYDVYARKRGTAVNFGDRRICRKGIKLLQIPEPVHVQSLEEVKSAVQAVKPPLVVAEAEESDATPVLETEEEVEPTATEDDVQDLTVPKTTSSPTIIDMERPQSIARRRISMDEDDEDSEFEFDMDTCSNSSSGSDEEEEVVLKKKSQKSKSRAVRELEDFNKLPSKKMDDDEVVLFKKKKKSAPERSNFNARLSNHTEDSDCELASKKKKKSKRRRPLFPVGTRFVKEFPDYGTFEGTITEFDGRHYHVYYPDDGDREELSEYEFDEYEILSLPAEDNAAVLDGGGKKRKKKKRRKKHREQVLA